MSGLEALAWGVGLLLAWRLVTPVERAWIAWRARRRLRRVRTPDDLLPHYRRSF